MQSCAGPSWGTRNWAVSMVIIFKWHPESACRNLTGEYFSISEYHPVTIRQWWGHSAQFCLGKSPEYKCFDLCYSFKTLVWAEYGGVKQLHDAVWNYQNNWLWVHGKRDNVRMLYEKALWNLIVFLFGHYIDSFESSGARKGHWAILALECFTVADELGR